MKTISSQRYLNEAIVESKVADHDFTVYVSPVFEIDGEKYRLVLDGHHSLAAAIETGNDPEFVEMTSMDHDGIQVLEDGNIDEFMTITHHGDDYYDVFTGEDCF